MIQGTTPTFSFTLPFDVDAVKSAEFTIEYFSGSKKSLILKEKADGVHEGSRMTFQLSQEETLKLPANSWVNVQLRVLTVDGKALATSPGRVEIKKLLKEGVIK